jgi:hypothetical protein
VRLIRWSYRAQVQTVQTTLGAAPSAVNAPGTSVDTGQRAPADELTARPGERIVELDALRQ